MASQQQSSNTPISSRDSWQTPQWLFDWSHKRFNFGVDLAASQKNKKCFHWLGVDNDALSQDWCCLHQHHGFLWLNCPYSETGKWIEKCWQEAQQGAQIVALIPTPNGENYWRHVFGWATEIIFINGHIAFELPDDNGNLTPKAGNTRGSCLVVFDGVGEQDTQISWIDRDAIKPEKKAA